MYDPVDKNVRTWAMLCHLTALCGYFIPFGNFLGPLLIWLIKGKEDPFIDEQGKEALNFQITWTIWIVVSLIFSFVLIGIPFLIGFALGDLILTIVAAVAANDGRSYRYPLTFRFIR